MSILKSPLARGAAMLISFGLLIFVMTLPIFRDEQGQPIYSLHYSDMIFNELSKGSSWFIPEVRARIAALGKREISLKIPLSNAAERELAARLLTTAGADAQVNGAVAFHGNLAAILHSATEDAEHLYNNDGAAVSARYGGAAPLQVASAWWHLLNAAMRQMQKAGDLACARAIAAVLDKAIEPGNNFYGMKAVKVADNFMPICGLLAFYVIYAVWYGFALYYIFQGLGLIHAAKKDA